MTKMTPDNMEQKAREWWDKYAEDADTHNTHPAEHCAAFARSLAPLPISMTEEAMPNYDAGLLNDFGGGNVEWWQDYLRAELGRSEQFYQEWYASTHTKTITVERTFTLSEVTAYADDLMTAHLDPGRVVDREKDEQGADWIHRARNHVNAKHGVSPDSA